MTMGDEIFVYNGLPTRVVFGSGTSARVGEEARRIGVKRPLVLSTPEQKSEAQALAAKLGMDIAGVFSRFPNPGRCPGLTCGGAFSAETAALQMRNRKC